MRFQFPLYAPFLLTLILTIALAAQPTPPPTTLSCTGTIPSPACTAATTVYNAIMANATATTALAGMVTTVQNATQSGSTGDPMFQSAQTLLTMMGPPPNFANYVKKCSNVPTVACQKALTAYSVLATYMNMLQGSLKDYKGDLSSLSSKITNLVTTQGTLGGLQEEPGTLGLTYLISDLNGIDDSLSKAQAIPVPPAPATPQKGAVSSKK